MSQLQQESELRRSSRTRNNKMSYSDYFSDDEDDDIEEEGLEEEEEYKDASDEKYIQEEEEQDDDAGDNISDREETHENIAKDINTKFACGLCSNILSDPYIIPACCHRFCCKCIQESIKAGDGPCPTCRDHSVSFQSLRRDEMMGRLLTRYKMLQEKIQKKKIEEEKHSTQRKRTLGAMEPISEESDSLTKTATPRTRKKRKRESKNELTLQEDTDDLKSIDEIGGRIQSMRAKRVVTTYKGSKKKKPKSSDKALNFNERLQCLRDFKKKYGHCHVPRSHHGLGKWCSNMRMIKAGTLKQFKSPDLKLTKKRMKILEDMGFFKWTIRKRKRQKHVYRSFDENFNALQSFKRKKGHCNVTVCNNTEDPSLAYWVSNIRKMKAGKLKPFARPNTKLTEARIAKLEALEFEWTMGPSYHDRLHKFTFDDYVRDLKAYKVKHGDCYVPDSYKDHKTLGRWVSKIRAIRAGTMQPVNRPYLKLTEERITELDSIGFKWRGWKTFDEYMEDLRQFKAKHGHCNVPFLYSENKSLGRWVGKIRRMKLGKDVDNGNPDRKLTKERIVQLDKMGFIWRLRS